MIFFSIKRWLWAYLVFACFGLSFADIKSPSGNLDFSVNSSLLMRLDATGLGIGVSTPMAGLDVAGDALISGSLSVGSAASTSSNLSLSGTLGQSYTTVSSNSTLDGQHSLILANNSSGNLILTLPDPPLIDGRILSIKALRDQWDLVLLGHGIDTFHRYTLSPLASTPPSTTLIASQGQWYVLSYFGSSNLATSALSFTATTDGTWRDGATWGGSSPGVEGIDFPGPSDTAIINGQNIVLNGNQNIAALMMSSGSLDTDNTENYHFNVAGNLLMNGGQFYARGSTVCVGGDFITSDNTNLFVAGTSTVKLTGSGTVSLKVSTSGTNGFYILYAGMNGNDTYQSGDLAISGCLVMGSGTYTSQNFKNLFIHSSLETTIVHEEGGIFAPYRLTYISSSKVAGITHQGGVAFRPSGGIYELQGNMVAPSLDLGENSGTGVAKLDLKGHQLTISGTLRLGRNAGGSMAGNLIVTGSTADVGNLDWGSSRPQDNAIGGTGATVTVRGNWANNEGDGKVNLKGSTLIFEKSSGSPTIESSGLAFSDVIFQGGADWSLLDDFNAGNVQLLGGTLDGGGKNFNLTGQLSLSANFNQGAGNLSVETLNLAVGSLLTSYNDGDLILGMGGVSNSGNLQISGGGVGCGDADNTKIISSNPGQARTWSGTGIFGISDVEVSDMAGGLSAGSSTDSGGNDWTISAACP